MSTINERIKELIDILHKGNVTSFANSINFGASTIHAIVGKKQSTPSFPVLYAIYDSLHSNLGLSAHWLLTGEGIIFDDSMVVLKGGDDDIKYLLQKGANLADKDLMDKLVEKLEDEIMRLKEDLRFKDAVITSREKFITTLLSNMNDNLTDKE